LDVRCEKCQTEYELDESRLKPGGVTVKCTNCGHMFKIRKRASSVVPVPQPGVATPSGPVPTVRASPGGSVPPALRGESELEPDSSAAERLWIIRLENGEQKTCRELAALQQWIVAGVVSRESMISRTGKTWKRLGDINELAQYFTIADEARTTRDERRAAPTGKQAAAGTMLGVGANDRATIPVPSAPVLVPAPAPSPAAPAIVPSGVLPAMPPSSSIPPPVMLRHPDDDDDATDPAAASLPDLRGPAPTGNRATAGWAEGGANNLAAAAATQRQSNPFVGRFAAGATDEPAFAGTVRAAPPDGARAFDTGRIRPPEDDDDDVLPRRSSSTGILILVMVLLVGGAAAAIVYFVAIRTPDDARTAIPAAKLDAGVLPAPPDATAVVVTPLIDAPAVDPAQPSPIDAARAELATDHEARLKTAIEAIAGSTEPAAMSLRALLQCGLAQAVLDRAGLVESKSEADQLRREVRGIAIEAATTAQRAYKAAADDPAANVALAHALRLQGKPAAQIQRYLEAARAKPGPYAREIALAEALVFARDGKLDEAKAAFAAIDSGDGKLETSNDVRARFHLALIALAQNRATDAKPLVDQVLAAQPDHAGARLLAGKLETSVVKTDPLPPEDDKPPPTPPPAPRPTGPDFSGDYDTLVRKGDAVANASCTKALDYYGKALEKKPNGVEALTGLGYCHLDAKNYASAHSRFRTALVVSPRYEPALAGIAEAYGQQGRRDDAIAAWRRYLEVYPNAKKGLAALDRLGVARDEPAPAPAPAPEPGAGSDA
jgi:predicted Zn finger-like uncharacterized protein